MSKPTIDNKINGITVPFLFKKEIISLPDLILIGRKVTCPIAKQGVPLKDGGNPPLNLLWQEYEKDGTRDWLIQNKASMYIEAALGFYFDINKDNNGTFSYIVGSLMKAETLIPNDFDSHEIPSSDFAVCWFKYKDGDDEALWSVAHAAVEDFMKEQGYEGIGGCSELYPFDDNDDEYTTLGYLIAAKKE